MSKAEKYIEDCTRNYSNELCTVEDKYGKKVISYHKWLTPEQALKAVEIAKEERLESVCEWLKKNVTYIHPRKGTETCIVNLSYLRQAMQDE